MQNVYYNCGVILLVIHKLVKVAIRGQNAEA